MTDRVLVDTNILVYAYDRAEPWKQEQALDILDRLAITRTGVLSTQVLGEFFVVATRKLSAPLSVAEAYERIQNHLRAWPVLEVTGLIVLEAARGVRAYQFSFWDAQIWATARLNQIPEIYSEDFNSNGVIEGIRFRNPLAPNGFAG